MPVVKDEQEVKRNSQFLEYEAGENGNMLILKSHLYKIESHFIEAVKRSVACKGEECLYCGANYKKGSEYNYLVFLNGNTGFLDVKGSVFFAMQGIAKAQKKDMRQISWTVIKKGEGLLTKYTTSKDDNLAKEDYQALLDELDANTEKLVAAMERHEEDLDTNYTQFMGQIRGQTVGKRKATEGKKEEEDIDPNDVDPNDVPF
jgi:hypothetical protein